MLRIFISALALGVMASLPAFAGAIEVSNAVGHVKDDDVNGRRIEVYMTIQNNGSHPDQLYAVKSDLARKVMISTAAMGHGAMAKAQTGSHPATAAFNVPANGEAVLNHMGSHIMVMNPGRTPDAGDTFKVTLFFEQAGRVTVDVKIAPAQHQ